jgi:superfamily II DNA or RNA helicase
LVIVHKEFLLNQWKERIQEFAPSARIGTIKAKTIDVEDKDIVIGSLQSLSMKDYDEDVFNGFGMLVVDEAHHTGAEVFSKALQKLNVRYTLGLSATVERKDGLSKVFKWYLGNVVYKKKNKGKDIIDVHMLEYTDQCKNYCEECTIFGNKPNMSKMINNICDYEPRVEFIVQKMQQVLENESLRRILVLSDRRSHLQIFKEMLGKYGIRDVGFYYGGMKQDDLKESEGRSIILGTYAMISEGFDVKGLDTLVLASPKSDVVQSVGRILRTPKHERKSVPLVIDIVDDFSMFPKQAKKRMSYYKSCKYNIFENNKPKVNSKKIVNIDDFAFKD